jgi:very-short-patch-repair endonuclease
VDTDQLLISLPMDEALRARPEALARQGWHYVRVHAMELFMQPDEVARRIGVLVGLIHDDTARSDAD